MSISYLCSAFGYSKQAYYKGLRSQDSTEEWERYLLSIIRDTRHDMPRLGTQKLWYMLNSSGLSIGRDHLYCLLRSHNLLIKRKKNYVKTTDSMRMAQTIPKFGQGEKNYFFQSSMGQ